MTTITNVNMIFLGTFGLVDNDESNWEADNAGSLLGNYTSLTLTDVTEVDRDDSGSISDDEGQAGLSQSDRDYLQYDVGWGQEAYEIDATLNYAARVVLGDGSTMDVDLAVLQTTVGDVFVRDTNNVLDDLNIQSIELLSVNSTMYSGSYTGNSIENSQVVCFAAGTLIDTPHGACPVERLRKGMAVTTMDHGAQPLRFVWRSRLSNPGGLAPILIRAHAMGPNRPATDLRVSPQHRILIRSRIALRMFDTSEVLVAARHLVDQDGVTCDVAGGVTYYHLLFQRHELVRANGLWAESLLTGPQTLRVLGGPSQFSRTDVQTARPIPPGVRAKSLIRRHRRNQCPLQAPRTVAAVSR